MTMKRNYVVFAALAGVLSLTACSGKPANEQAAEDVQKINIKAMIPGMAARLTAECSRGAVAVSCAAQKAQTVIKADPSFKAAIAGYDKKCVQNYGAKMCAQGYATHLANNLAAKLAEPVTDRAETALKARAEQVRRAEAAAAKAKAEAEAAAARAKAAAEEAARKAAEAAKQAEGTAAAPAPKAAAPAAAPAPAANAGKAGQ